MRDARTRPANWGARMKKLIAGAVLAVVMLAGVGMPGTAFADIDGPPPDVLGCASSDAARNLVRIDRPGGAPGDPPGEVDPLCFDHS